MVVVTNLNLKDLILHTYFSFVKLLDVIHTEIKIVIMAIDRTIKAKCLHKSIQFT